MAGWLDRWTYSWMNKMKECQNAWLNHNKSKHFVANNKKLKNKKF